MKKKIDIKKLCGETITYINPINGVTYKNATIIHVVNTKRMLPKKYLYAVGHNDSYKPYKRPYPSVVVKLENGRICFPRLNVNDLF